MIRKCLILTGLLILIISAGCKRKLSVPFPENASEYKVPDTLSFEYPEGEAIAWNEVSKDSFPEISRHRLNLDQLPAKPFTINSFKPLKEPLQSIPLDWENLEEHALHLDTIKTDTFRIKSFLMPNPVITESQPPSQFPRSSSGILQIGMEEGLPGNYVEEIITDRDGTIWISSEKGLIRYKGEFFETFDFLPRLPNSNPDHIIDMKVDRDNNIWVITFSNKLYKIEPRLGIAHHIQLSDPVIRMTFDANGKLWYTSFGNGAGILDVENQTIQRILASKTPEDNLFFGIHTDRENNVWIGNRTEIYIANETQNTYKEVKYGDDNDRAFIFGFYETRKGDIWVNSFFPGAFCIAADRKSIQVLDKRQDFHGTPLIVSEDEEGKIWLFDNDTIFVHHPGNSTYKKIPTGVKVYIDRTFGNAVIDRNQNLWLTTPQNRTMIIDPMGPLPEHIDMDDGLASNDVWGIIEDKDGLIWMGSYNGLNIYDPVSNTIKLIDTEHGLSHSRRSRLSILDNDKVLAAGTMGYAIIDKQNNSLTEYKTDFQIWFTHVQEDGKIWLAGTDGLYLYDNANETFKKAVNFKDKSLGRIWTGKTDHEGKIWCTTINDVFVIDPEQSTILNFPNDYMTCDNFFAIHKYSENELWIVGDLGLSVLNTQKKTIVNVNAEHGLIPETSYAVAERNDQIYLGSSDGIVVVNPPNENMNEAHWRFYNYNKRNGFPFNDYNQTATLTTSDGQIWWGVVPQVTILTQQPIIDRKKPLVHISGIRIMDQDPQYIGFKDQMKVFERIDTLQNEDMTDYYVKSTFPEDSAYYTKHKIKWDSMSPLFHLPMGLKLPYDQNSVSFSFTNMNIRSRDKIVYRYMLEGADVNWSRLTDESVSKDYYDLKQGKYEFKVSTRGFNGKWSDVATYEFAILAPWYATWLAYILYILLGMGLIRIYIVYRSRKLEMEKKILEERVRHRTKQLTKSIEDLKATQQQLVQSEKMASLGELTAGIAHEIQNPLNFVNNFADVNIELIDELKEEIRKGNLDEVDAIAEDLKGNEKKIIHHGKRAESIVKGMLLHSRGNSGQKEPTDIKALADEYLRLSFHGLRAKDKSFNAEFSLKTDQEIDKINIVPQDVGRVLLNLINNAFYAVSKKAKEKAEGYKPTVEVNITRNSKSGKGEWMQISVKDNGPGIPEAIKEKIFQPFFTTKPAGEGTGLGLSLSYEIITKGHGGRLKLESEENKGTEFIIELPYKS